MNALTCTCNCGASTYNPTASCTTATHCSQICYWGYSSCIKSYTQGCCGTLGCAWYSGDSVYNQPGICVCQCTSSSYYASSEQGRANTSMCSTSTCQRACQFLYPSSCGTYTNNAYCASNGNLDHRMNIYFLVFFFVLVIFCKQ